MAAEAQRALALVQRLRGEADGLLRDAVAACLPPSDGAPSAPPSLGARMKQRTAAVSAAVAGDHGFA